MAGGCDWQPTYNRISWFQHLLLQPAVFFNRTLAGQKPCQPERGMSLIKYEQDNLCGFFFQPWRWIWSERNLCSCDICWPLLLAWMRHKGRATERWRVTSGDASGVCSPNDQWGAREVPLSQSQTVYVWHGALPVRLLTFVACHT